MNRKHFKKLVWIPVGILSLFIIILAALSITAQIVLTPDMSLKLIRRFAPEYYEGGLKLGKADLSVFKNFPRLTADIDSLVLTYPASVFDSSEAAAGRIDTLASFNKFSASLSTVALLRGMLKLDDIQLHNPRVFIHVFDDGRCNWDLLKLETSTKIETEEPHTHKSGSIHIPHITLNKLYLGGHPYIVFKDQLRDIDALLTMDRYYFDGKLSTTRLSAGVFTTAIDSLQLSGRMASDTLNFSLDRFDVKGKRGRMQMDVKATTLMSTDRFGRIMVPFGLMGNVDMKNRWNGNIWMHLKECNVDVATVKLLADLEVELATRMKIKGNVTVPPVNVQQVLSHYLYKVIPQSRDITTDLEFSSSIDVDGTYNLRTGELPGFAATLDIPRSFIRHSDIHYVPNIELHAGLSGEQGGKVDATVAKLRLDGPEFDFNASGNISDLTGDDPLTDIVCSLDTRLDSLGHEFCRHFDIDFGGRVKMDAKGTFNLSNINKYNFANAAVNADIDLCDIVLKSLDDRFTARLDKGQLRAAVMDDRFRKDSKAKDRSLGIKLDLGNLKMKYGSIADINAENVSALFQNSSDKVELSDTLRYHPNNLQLDIEKAAIKAQGGLSASIQGSHSHLQMKPSVINERIPVYDIESDNSLITAGKDKSIARMNGLKVKIHAQTTDIRNKRRLQTMMDSMMRANPASAPDSLWRFLVYHPHEPKIPHLLGMDIKKKTVSPEDAATMLTDKMKKWDFDGNIAMGRTVYGGLVMKSLTTDLRIKDQCLQLTRLGARTNAGNFAAEGYFSTKDAKGAKVAMTADIRNIEAGTIIAAVPQMDTLAPMLKSFSGKFNCNVAASARLDKAFNPISPSIDGVFRFTGDSLYFKEDKTITTVARLLWMKNAEHATIEHLDIQGMIRNNTLEIFPFLIKLENWTLALAGEQHMDQSFHYNINLLKCPFGIRFGADISGKDFKHTKFNLGKTRYDENSMPSYRSQIDAGRSRLSNHIQNVFDTNTQNVTSTASDVMRFATQQCGYVSPSKLDDMAELSDSEKKVLDDLNKKK